MINQRNSSYNSHPGDFLILSGTENTEMLLNRVGKSPFFCVDLPFLGSQVAAD